MLSRRFGAEKLGRFLMVLFLLCSSLNFEGLGGAAITKHTLEVQTKRKEKKTVRKAPKERN